MNGIEKCIEMALHAYKDVEVYRSLARDIDFEFSQEDKETLWETLPLLERKYMIEHADHVLSDDCIALMYSNQLIRSHTSGSTGLHTDVWWRKKDYRNSLLPLWMKRYKTAAITPNDKVCIFNAFSSTGKMLQYDKQILLISKVDLSEEGLKKIYHAICEFQPRWMLLQPSMAMLLCEIMEKYLLPKIESVVYIELTGEMCVYGTEKRLEDTFSCLIKKHYGTMEVSSIGYETDERNVYEILTATSVVEVLDEKGRPVEEGEIGKIYVTSLHNYAMPIVRYGTGDMGKLYSKNVNGHKRQYLRLMNARQNDQLMLKEDEWILSDVLLGPIEQINQAYENAVLGFEAIQNDLHNLEFHIVLDEEFSQDEFCFLYEINSVEMIKKQFVYHFYFEKHLKPIMGTQKLKWFTGIACKDTERR